MATLDKEKLVADLKDILGFAEPLAASSGGDRDYYSETFKAWHSGAISGNAEAVGLILNSIEWGEYDVETA